jgi:rhodanese-related sulfurtransferase
MEGLARDLKRDVNRQLWGDGTGSLTTCTAASGVNIIPVVSTKFIRVGMVVDIITVADGTVVASARNVTAVVTNTSITIDGAVATVTTGEAVFRTGSRNYEMMGFNGIFSTSKVLQGINPSSAAYWKANILANGGTPRAISEALLQTALDTTDQLSDGKVTALYTSYGVRRAYQALLTTSKRYTNPKQLKGGYEALDYNGLPFIVDKDAPAGAIWCPDENELSIFRLADFDWMEEDGAILHRAANKDAYEAVMFAYMELGTSMRNAQTKIEDIIEG